MRTVRVRLLPQSAFGTVPWGDTFFGQLCWAIRNRFGEERLTTLLEGYTQGAPFLVVSDALPSGYLPKPRLPAHLFLLPEETDRKELTKRRWLPVESVREPVSHWVRYSVAETDLPGGWYEPHLQPHNSINRQTGTTGVDLFAPYVMEQYWFGRKVSRNGRGAVTVGPLDLYCLVDDSRPEGLTVDELRQTLSDIGELGFGRDASIGLGRFTVEALDEQPLPAQEQANAYLTLAPCAPQGLPWQAERCFYRVFTRFGRHGDVGVHSGHPFKTPVLLTVAGSVFTPVTFAPRPFIGQGLGGDSSLSKSMPKTVQQGYAPVVAIRLHDG